MCDLGDISDLQKEAYLPCFLSYYGDNKRQQVYPLSPGPFQVPSFPAGSTQESKVSDPKTKPNLSVTVTQTGSRKLRWDILYRLSLLSPCGNVHINFYYQIANWQHDMRFFFLLFFFK